MAKEQSLKSASVDGALKKEQSLRSVSIDAGETKIFVNGAGMTDANGLYSKVIKNFLPDKGVAVYECQSEESEKNWKQRWIICYYPSTTSGRDGPAWYIQKGLSSVYWHKLTKDLDGYREDPLTKGFPDLSSAKIPSSGWHTVPQGKFQLEGAKGPAPRVDPCPSANDIQAAVAMLQHISEDPSRSLQALAHVGALAAEARRLMLSGALSTEPLWDGAKTMKPFNEVRVGRGKCRPAYSTVVDVMEKIMEEDREKEVKRIDSFPEVSNGPKGFRGDNRLYHLPRMLTQAETDLLVKGIAQRASALRHFVLDMHKSRGVEMMDCVRQKALPEDVFRRIHARASEKPVWDLSKGDPSKLYWNMWYGPDIIRGPNEKGGFQFYVVEDNLGYVGGFGDLIDARKILLKTFPQLEPAIGADKTADFYDEMCKHYHAMVAPGEKVVVLYYPRKGKDMANCSDNEDRRMVELLRSRGIFPVPLPGKAGPKPGDPKLEVRRNKVFLVHPSKKSKEAKEGEVAKEVATGVEAKDKDHHRKSPSPAKRTKSPARGVVPGSKEPKESQEAPRSPTSRSPARKLQRIGDGPLEEPVGLVILLSEPTDVQPGHESTKLRAAMDEARARILDYAEQVVIAKFKARGAQKSVVKVPSKLDIVSDKGLKSTLEMKGKTLIWTVYDKEGKEQDRIKGPLSFDLFQYRLSAQMTDGGKKWSAVFTEKVFEDIQKNCSLEESPPEIFKLQNRVDELKASLEQVGQLVGGQANDTAPKELFRLLQLDNKEKWMLLMKGRRGVPNLLEAYYAGGVKLSNGPGFELLGDKELCSHVDKLIQHYLHEEPILLTIPTRSFATDPHLLSTVFDDPRTQENVVVKRVDGRGGDAVWVGAKLSRSDFTTARPLVEAEPDAFIVQKYTALSQVDGQLVDLRGPAFFGSHDDELSGGRGISVSPVLWGRGVPEKGGNGKVNISDAGFQLTIATSADA